VVLTSESSYSCRKIAAGSGIVIYVSRSFSGMKTFRTLTPDV
jgi:hypothetical protein